MTSKKALDAIPDKFFLSGIFFIHLFSIIILFYGFYPGGLCPDTVSIIHHGITGELTNNDPPVLQLLAGLAYFIYPNQSPLLLTQLVGYFLGIFLLAFYFFKNKNRILAICIILLSWFPYNIFLHAMVVKDVALMVVWLNIFALSINSTITSKKQYRLFMLIINTSLLLFGILVRDNSFVATPALLFLVLNGYNPSLLKTKSIPIKAMVIISSILLAFVFMKAVNGFFLSDTIENRDYKSSYLVNQLCKYDLIGMSVLDGHSGITSTFNEKDKHQIELVYKLLPIYWAVDKDGKLIENDFDILSEWKKTIRHNPLLYIRHRFHIFKKTFGGNAFSQLMWVRQTQEGLLKKNILLFNQIPLDKFYTPDSHKNNIVYRTIRSYLELYFIIFGSALPFALVGIIMIVHTIYLAHVKKQDIPAVNGVCYTNLAAFLYYAPYLFFVHQAETRYVYPSIVLIIFSIPIYLTCCFFKSRPSP